MDDELVLRIILCVFVVACAIGLYSCQQENGQQFRDQCEAHGGEVLKVRRYAADQCVKKGTILQ